MSDEWTTLIQLLSDGTKASPWNIRTAILEGMEVIFGKTKKIDTISATSRQMLLESLYFSLEDAKYTGVREACLRVLKLVVPLLTSSGLSPEERADIKERLKRYADKESSTLLADYLGALSAAL